MSIVKRVQCDHCHKLFQAGDEVVRTSFGIIYSSSSDYGYREAQPMKDLHFTCYKELKKKATKGE